MEAVQVVVPRRSFLTACFRDVLGFLSHRERG
jgi:hypothetical protein